MKILNDNILEHIRKKNRMMRVIALAIGAFIVAFMYNAFIVPNNLVYGGMGGLAIIIHNLFGISTTFVLNIITIFLIIISLLIIGLKKTSYAIVGYGMYTLMINVTAPLVKFTNLNLDSFLFSVVIYSVIMGIGYGLIYKAGFNTGGSDTIIAIIQHFKKSPVGKISNVINGIIILIGATNFGITKSLYALIFLKMNNFISDAIILGISNSKICFIRTKKWMQIENYLESEFEIGYTVLESTNGVGILKKPLLFVVIPSDRFYDLKKELLNIDRKIELLSTDCYTVENGHTNRLINIT